jgi:hypothetical protein
LTSPESHEERIERLTTKALERRRNPMNLMKRELKDREIMKLAAGGEEVESHEERIERLLSRFP